MVASSLKALAHLLAAKLSPDGGLKEWPMWVSLADFELVFSLPPPSGVQPIAWLTHLCATRYLWHKQTLLRSVPLCTSFFFGRISTQSAVEMVAERGSFLLRLSSQPGALTLTVGLGERRAYHHRITRSSSGNFSILLPNRQTRKDEEHERLSLWALLQLAINVLGLRKGAGRSPYRRAMPSDEKDPWEEFLSDARP